jgi:hypothetical protein
MTSGQVMHGLGKHSSRLTSDELDVLLKVSSYFLRPRGFNGRPCPVNLHVPAAASISSYQQARFTRYLQYDAIVLDLFISSVLHHSMAI